MAYPRFGSMLGSEANGRQTARGLHLRPLLNEPGHCNVLHLLIQPVILHLDAPAGKGES